MSIKTITVHKTDNVYIEQLLLKHYAIEHEIHPAEELGSQDWTVHVSGDPLDEYELDTFARVCADEFVMGSTQALMNKLCVDGFIPAGDYIVDCNY